MFRGAQSVGSVKIKINICDRSRMMVLKVKIVQEYK
jgi:hypothetical protein